MQLNFEKRNLKSCNGSLRFIRKASKWQIFLCNFATISCNSMQFYLKKGYFLYIFHENNNFKKHEIAIKILII